jgi:hypothetical protein
MSPDERACGGDNPCCSSKYLRNVQELCPNDVGQAHENGSGKLQATPRQKKSYSGCLSVRTHLCNAPPLLLEILGAASGKAEWFWRGPLGG